MDEVGVRLPVGPPEFNMEPQFFDIFGFLGFIFITVFSFFMLRGSSMPRWSVFVLLVIGILGLFIDGTIVYISYLK